PLDENAPFVRRIVGEEATHFRDGWYLAGEIEIDATQELRVLRARRWPQLLLGPPFGEPFVDLVRQLRRVSGASSGRREDRQKHNPSWESHTQVSSRGTRLAAFYSRVARIF